MFHFGKLQLFRPRLLPATMLSIACVVLSSLPIYAQPAKSPRPEEVKARILKKVQSDLDTVWNYRINGKKPPDFNYDGPYEGGPPDSKVIRQTLVDDLPRQTESIRLNPRSAPLYESRGTTYARLFDVTRESNERSLYAEQSLTDFNKAIALDKQAWTAYESRARLLSSIDFLAYFDNIVSDELNSVNLMAKYFSKRPEVTPEYNAKISEVLLVISGQYWNRANALSLEPKLLVESKLLNGYVRYSYWEDFDIAVKYARENVTKPNDVRLVVNYLMDKGNTAYRLGSYTIAIEAYNSAVRYWSDNSAFFCSGFPTLCEDEKRSTDSVLTRELVKVYVKKEMWKPALVQLNHYLSDVRNTYCPEPFTIRAKVHRNLGETDLALTDDQKADEMTLSSRVHNCIEDWE
jgi:tetratricopeptide (TPR) repeat protein